DGPEWFAKLFPTGLSVAFGVDDATRFTLLEAAVFAMAGPGRFNWSNAAICEETGLKPASLLRVKRSLQRKYERWQKAYWEGRGRQVLCFGQLFEDVRREPVSK
ncbi:hypothetical protein B7486_61605, partial [cyanobacterium TDX16]